MFCQQKVGDWEQPHLAILNPQGDANGIPNLAAAASARLGVWHIFQAYMDRLYSVSLRCLI